MTYNDITTSIKVYGACNVSGELPKVLAALVRGGYTILFNHGIHNLTVAIKG